MLLLLSSVSDAGGDDEDIAAEEQHRPSFILLLVDSFSLCLLRSSSPFTLSSPESSLSSPARERDGSNPTDRKRERERVVVRRR